MNKVVCRPNISVWADNATEFILGYDTCTLQRVVVHVCFEKILESIIAGLLQISRKE